MSIAVVCACGKSMRAPAEWAGRDAKCPGCGQAVHIPGNGKATATAPVRANNPPVTPCPACGKPLLVPPGMAGKLVACPACGGHVKLPGKPADVTAKAPAFTVPAPRPKSKSQLHRQPAKVATFEMDGDDDDFDDDDLGSARRGKKRKAGKKQKAGSGRLLLWCALGGGGFVALLLLVVLIVLLGGGGGSPVLAMVPADVEAFGMVRVGNLLRTPSGQKLRKMAIDLQKDDNAAKEIDNYQDMVIFNRNGRGPLIIASTSSPVDAAVSEKQLVNSHTRKQLEGKTFFAPNNAAQLGIFLHGPRIAILGAEADIVDYLKQPPAPAGPMAPMLRAAGSDSSMIFVAFQGSLLRNAPMGPMGPMALMGGVPEFQQGRFTLNDGTRMAGNLALDFADAAKAATAKDNLDKMLDMARKTVPMQMKMMPGPMAGLVEKTLAKATPALSGTTVNVPIDIEMSMGDLVEKMQPMFAMMAMMGGGMGPGFGPGPGMGPGPGPGFGPGPGARPGPGFPQPKMPGKNKRP